MSKQYKDSKFNASRRNFLKYTGGCSAIASTSAMSQLVSLAMTQSAVAAPQSEYKAMICLFLEGGNDSYNMLIPFENNEHADYTSIRTQIAIPREQLANTAITDPNSGRQFAFHPNMVDCRDMYNNGSLACVANVGTLVEPVTATQFRNRFRNPDVTFPVGLFSHSDHQRAWQTALPQSRDGLTGWGGRCSDLLNDTVNNNPALSIGYSLDGERTFLNGQSTFQYALNENSGADLLNGFNGGSTLDRILTRTHNSLTNATYANLLVDTFANTKFNAVNGAIEYNNSTSEVELNTVFPDNSLGREMDRVMRTISVQQSLQQTRQIFFVQEGNWDHHGDFNDRHPPQIQKINDTLKAVHDAIIEIGAEGQVLLFIASDFARTLTFNGSGTDHAWGGNVLLLGPGVVNGGRVYGTYPESLRSGNPLDIGRGRLVPTSSVDEYYLEIADWFGIDRNSTEMQFILPNIGNFWSPGQALPFGFIS